MKKVFTFSFMLLCWGTFAQTHQNINKNTGTVSNPINRIDSIRFNTVTNQMEVVQQSGVETHALADVVNVTFSTSNSCGSNTTVTDIDGNVYQTVSIGTQCWMKENLKVSKYRNGDPIPTGLSKTAWRNATTGAYAIYKKNAANNTTYGKLYNWYAVADSRSLCPVGWHIPTDDEWTTLENYLGGTDVAGGKLKSTSTLWNAPNTSATNESGFSGLPGGDRGTDGTYGYVGIFGNWWSSTEHSTSLAWFRFLIDNYGYSGCNFYTSKQLGFSVRCLRD
jgi:uncharacterized protein (TIGR02145 family)